MQTWQYVVEEFTGIDEMRKRLTSTGFAGWEVVSVVRGKEGGAGTDVAEYDTYVVVAKKMVDKE
jgi:Fe2+ transport system protein FeoA